MPSINIGICSYVNQFLYASYKINVMLIILDQSQLLKHIWKENKSIRRMQCNFPTDWTVRKNILLACIYSSLQRQLSNITFTNWSAHMCQGLRTRTESHALIMRQLSYKRYSNCTLRHPRSNQYTMPGRHPCTFTTIGVHISTMLQQTTVYTVKS